MRLGIIVDNPRRDLKGCLLLAMEALSRGYDVYLIPVYSQGFDVPLLGLDAIVVNYLRVTNKDFLETYRQLGIKIFVMDTEAGLLATEGPRSPKGWAEFVTEQKLTYLIDGYCFWGEALFDGFKKHSDLKPEQMCVTGMPRYDVTHESNRDLLYITKSKYTLINTNFAGINPKFGKKPEYEVKTSAEAGVGSDLVWQIIKDQKSIMDKMLEEVKKILEFFPENEFILRPHPFEGEQIYREKFKDYKNVRVNGEGEIFDAVQGANLLLHVNCTTSIDAFFFEVPSVSLEYINTKLMSDYMRVPSLISLSAHSTEELISYIKRNDLIDLQRPKFNQNLDLINSSFGSRDGKSSKRIMDYIENVAGDKSKTKVDIISALNMGKNKKLIMKEFLEGFLCFIFGVQNIIKIRNILNPIRKDKAIPVSEVREVIGRRKSTQLEKFYISVKYATFGFHNLSSIKLSASRKSSLE